MSLSGGLSRHAVLALTLLVAAAGVDLVWVRPQETELRQAGDRRRATERALRNLTREHAEKQAILDYIQATSDSADAWRGVYTGIDPIQVLENLRREAGLRRLDLQFREREEAAPFLKSTYYMSVLGSYDRLVGFLKALEQSEPLAAVESFVLEEDNDQAGTGLNLHVSMLTLPREDAP